MAFSATEHAVSVLNAAAAASPRGWRGAYVSGQIAFTQAVGRGQFSWAVKDETDGNLSADYLRSCRVYGIGRVGSVTRVYSVQIAPGGSPLDVLRTAIHSADSITLTGNAQAGNGPFSSGGNVSLSGKVNGAIEAASASGSAGGTQTLTVPAPAKTMPSTTVFEDLAASATAIDFNSLSGSRIEKCLLSATSNPYGAGNAKGLYIVTVPSTKKLTVQNCRIVGTLLVRGGSSTTVELNGPMLWEDGPSGGPTLVVAAPGVTVTISGSNTWLSEGTAGVNMNPATTPFGGDSNTTANDDFPPQYRGIIHVMSEGSGQVTLKSNAYLSGTLIADCPVATANQFTAVQDPSLFAAPPFGYASGDALTEVPGTWRWDTLP